MNNLLEICVDSLISARHAISGGAHRLELCSALAVGGLTPYADLLRQIRRESDIPIRCLIRHRPGDFLYSPDELELLRRQIMTLKQAGADGFVIGCLTPWGELDKPAVKYLIDACGGSGVTLHRCIDVSADPRRTYLDAMELGMDTVLTSGCASCCADGMETIKKLISLRDSAGGPEVMIGAGVSPSVIARFRREIPSARAFHMSGKINIPSGMLYRREGVPMGLPGLDEWHIQQTAEDAVAAARRALDL